MKKDKPRYGFYGFERREKDGTWSADACGVQDASNYLNSEAEASAELPNLARVLECDVSELRVVGMNLAKAAPLRAEKHVAHVDFDFLKALRMAVDHVGAREPERNELEHVFRDACARRGLDPVTIAIAIEALC